MLLHQKCVVSFRFDDKAVSLIFFTIMSPSVWKGLFNSMKMYYLALNTLLFILSLIKGCRLHLIIFLLHIYVSDAVKAPVLTVNSVMFSSNSCTVNFTCRTQDLVINSNYQNNTCSQEEVTSQENNTLILSCSEELIMCNYSNPVSWKKDETKIKQLCVNKGTDKETPFRV